MSNQLKVLNLKIEINKGYVVKDPSKQPEEDKNVISVRHGSVQYLSFIKNITSLGAISAKLVKVFIESGEKRERGEPLKYNEIPLDSSEYKEKIESIQSDLKNAFKKEVELTPEQKQIAELNEKIAKMEALMSGKELKEEAKTVSDDDIDDLQPLRDEYRDLSGGKEPDARWKESRLNKEIAKLKE